VNSPLARGDGLHVWDAAGRRYLDATSGAFCVNLGYARSDLVRAMADAATRLPHARPSLFDSEEGAAYRAALLGAAGAPYARAVLTSSGSEAVDVAIKIAHRYQEAVRSGGMGAERRGIVALRGHYHGATLGALEATGWAPRRGPYDGLLGERPFGPPPTCARCFRSLVYPTCAIACADAALSDAEAGGAAAFLAETIPAAGLAAAIPPPGWLARVRSRCDAAGLLWIADEVLTGFGRTGDLFAWRRLAERAAPDGSRPDAGLTPDLIVFGKGAGAGYAAIGGVLMSERVASALDAAAADGGATFAHHQTHGGNPIASAVGRRVLGALEDERIFAGVREREAIYADAFGALRGRPGVFDVRGLGALWGVEIAGPGGRPFPRAHRVAERVRAACEERSVLVHAASAFLEDARGDAVVVAPPLVALEDAIRETVAALAAAIQEVVATV
jgi:adenosylmethionine-8-amino-7-oxononanoate aminotransferase